MKRRYAVSMLSSNHLPIAGGQYFGTEKGMIRHCKNQINCLRGIQALVTNEDGMFAYIMKTTKENTSIFWNKGKEE